MKTQTLMVAALVGLSFRIASTAQDQFAAGVRLGDWAGADIVESSGIAQSQSGQDVFWTHGDNGENWLAGARRDGTYLGRLRINGLGRGDTEDIATGPGPVAGENYIYYGDIGDNGGKRSAGIQVYRMIEPALNGRFGSLTIDCDRLRFQYPDGPRDCETLMVDPWTKDLYFVSKRDNPVRLYVARYPQSTNTNTTLEKLGDLPVSIGTWITAGDISADGSEIILRNDVKTKDAPHSRVFLWRRAPGESVYQALSRAPAETVLNLPQPQGEAVCWAKDGSGFYTSSEGPMRLDWYPRLISRLARPADLDATLARILIIVGPTDHPPGTHEVAAGARLLRHCLENMANLPGVKVDLFNEWPKDKTVRDAADTIVFIGDTFPPNRLPNAEQNLAELEEMMQRGCGIVCVHYATGLLGEDVKPDGDHPLLRWMGGYFANRSCAHHESFAKIFHEATIAPAAPQHPVWRGCREFTLNDEPYYNNYFGKDSHQPATNVTVLATSMLPPAAPKPEAVAWCVQRPDSGRGFAVVMPHFYRNWKLEDLRRFILNGIVWTAKRDVPPAGVQTTLPALSTFEPVSIEPLPPAPKKKAAPQNAASPSK